MGSAAFCCLAAVLVLILLLALLLILLVLLLILLLVLIAVFHGGKAVSYTHLTLPTICSV